MNTLQLHLSVLGLPSPTPEHRFGTRRWRFDFAFVEQKLAVEIEGGIYIQGRHSRGKGMEADMQKYNEASILGWRILRFTPGQVEKGIAAHTIQRWFMANGVRGKE
jgi:very-short-patch-repair endonuclease